MRGFEKLEGLLNGEQEKAGEQSEVTHGLTRRAGSWGCGSVRRRKEQQRVCVHVHGM